MLHSVMRLHLPASEFLSLLEKLGPSLGVWRAAEIAALRMETYAPPVLDLGCGDGLVTSFVLPRVEIGVDPSAAIQRAAASRVYQRIESRPIQTVDVAPGSIGTVISNSVLEHVADLPAALDATARLLRPGGHLIFTAPTEAFSDWLTLPAKRYSDWRNRHYEHRNLWSVERWEHELGRSGLRVVKVRPYLRREMVRCWDALELLQRVWIGKRRLFSVCWRRLPRSVLTRLAQRLARVDLSAPAPGGGRLIVAVRH
jgi:SAM-dependent methyltransferase